MVQIETDNDKIIFEIEGWDKLWSLRSRLEIPLEHIEGARVEPNPPMGWFDGLKVSGAALPNIFRAGTFYQEGDFVFWDVHEPEKTIVIELMHERYAKLFIEVDNPEEAVSLVNKAVAKHRRRPTS